MSQEINPPPPIIHRPPLPDLQHDQQTKPDAAQKSEAIGNQAAQPVDFLRSTLQKLAGGREHQDDKRFKNFTKLSRTLEQTFAEADKVNREDGEREMRQGGLRRIDTDLRKLFKGLGMPPQLAKHFSRGITTGLQDKDLEQISFSLTSSRSFTLAGQQQQSGYLATGDGKKIAASSSDSFLLSAVQTRTIDISINLRTGEFSLSRTSSESLSFGTSSTAALASFSPPAQGAETNSAEVPAPQEALTSPVQRDRALVEISRNVKQSTVMQLQPATNSAALGDGDDELFNDGVSGLQQLVERLEKLTEAARDMFESLVEIHNLRIEHDEDDDDEHLRFTMNAQAPIGLTATDGEGRGTTIYPRPDGSLGKISDAEVKVTA